MNYRQVQRSLTGYRRQCNEADRARLLRTQPQHSSHVADYYWHWHKHTPSSDNGVSESFYWRSQDYGMAARDGYHAARFFRH